MKNILISDLHKKDVEHFTSDSGLFLRKVSDRPFKKACNIFTDANIIIENVNSIISDDIYFNNLDTSYIPLEKYEIKNGKNNIIVERYPKLNKDEPYIFVCNHTCPEDIETVLNIIDRNSYLVLGSVESLQNNPEMYLTWLNGMIPFDIMDENQRKQLMEKMSRVIKTNSILIFPEGSHNYNPNKLINNLFDGPINLALNNDRRIVPITLIRDDENSVSYIDVGNPIDVKKIKIDMNQKFYTIEEKNKYYVNSLSLILRDKMATSVYYMMSRHFEILKRKDHDNIEEYIRSSLVENAFNKLKWERDVFDAEYLTKKTQKEKEYEIITTVLSELAIKYLLSNPNALLTNDDRNWILKYLSIESCDVPQAMRNHLFSRETSKEKKLERNK